MKPITSQECLAALKEGITKFGTYDYYDKGVDSVMFIPPLLDRFKQMSAKDVQKVLLEVLEYEHGKHFVGFILMCLEEMPDAYWDELTNDPSLNKLLL